MKTTDLTRIALMTAVLCILAPISIPVPVSSVAMSLATFAIYLMAYILKPRQSLAAIGLYLLLGAAGLPVFSGYMAGISRFAAPGGGYLMGYLFLAGISSLFIHRSAKIPVQMTGILLGTLAMYSIGTYWLAVSTGISFLDALPAGMLTFLPFDLIKIILATYIGRKIQLHIKK
ncbi:MAG: biotin transporter BioY [Anaerotignum sp.]|nr:biotin transporter BioY [Anaerotignum sp.]